MAVQLTHVDHGIVVTVHDETELAALRRMASDARGSGFLSIVVEVSELTMAPLTGVERLVAEIREAARGAVAQRWALVASRLSARRILRQLCADTAIGIYPTIEAALVSGPAWPTER